LFKLEAQIDDALLTARSIDPVGLEEIIALLRKARNKVIVRLAGD
jgi:DNA-binding MurR/RpiR family transcriptional regulator